MVVRLSNRVMKTSSWIHRHLQRPQAFLNPVSVVIHISRLTNVCLNDIETMSLNGNEWGLCGNGRLMQPSVCSGRD